MENFFTRYKNPLVLMAILFVQVIALATQVKRPEAGKSAANSGGTRLIRVWTVSAMSPFERALVSTSQFFRRNFHNYLDLRDVRKQNRELQDEIARLKLDQVRLQQDAEQARRLQTLLGFTQHYIGQVVPAQVIGTSGALQSHILQIDKGSKSGIKVDNPVITPDGIVGKVKDVFPYTSQVLMISDRDSGAGVILQNSRLQGILRGTPQGELHVSDIMSDEKIDVGEQVVTSGGDRIYPKGLPVGTVTQVSPDNDNDPFLAVRVKPAADLSRLEEVLVVTKIKEEVPEPSSATSLRAADILSERLPSVPKPDEIKKADGNKGAATSPAVVGGAKPAGGTTATQPKTNVPPKPGETPAPKIQPGPGAAVTSAGASRQPRGPKQAGSTAAGPERTTESSAGLKKPGAVAPEAGTQASPEKSPTPVRQTTSAAGGTVPPKKTPPSATATSTTTSTSGVPNSKSAASPVKKPKPQASPAPTIPPEQTKTASPTPAATPETPPR